MKKLSIVMCALALVGVLFTGCKEKKETKTYDDIVENGFFIVGDAVGILDLTDSRVVAAAMTPGTNEVTKTARDGMYEKYVMLLGGKNFQFIKKEGNNKVYYGANLTAEQIETDGTPADGYRGVLAENVTMTVPEDGMYHIIMDFNVNGDIPAQEIVLVPVFWGVAGCMNGWDYTPANDIKKDFVAQTASYTWSDVEISGTREFKFKHGKCWKYQLDELGEVKAENSLGKDMIAGGGNIVAEENGIYDITLNFAMKGGAINESFTMVLTKKGNVQIKDYSNCQMELVGDAVADQEGAEPDSRSGWSWGNVFPMGKPSKDGNVYTWKVEGVQMKAGKFKVRTVDYAAQGDIAAFDNGSDQVISSEDKYDITFTLNAETSAMNVTIEGGAPVVPQIVKVSFKLPATWTNTPTAWIWEDGKDGAVANLTQEGEKWTYTTPSEVTALNIIVRNGADWGGDANQTVDIRATESTCYELASDGATKATYTVVACE